MNSNNAQRNKKIDILKGLAIILVIIGHCIQYGSGEMFSEKGLFFYNILFKIIYSFHMPLFMLISGYLLGFSVEKYNTKKLIERKMKTLLIPILSFSFLMILIYIINTHTISLGLVLNLIFSYLWFLWAVLIFSITVSLNKGFLNDSIVIYILLLIMTFFAPSVFNLHLYGYMYPFFMIGYYFNKYKDVIKYNNIGCMLTSFIVWITLLSFYKYNSYIYTSGISIINNINQLPIDLFRFAIGLFGSIFVILFIEEICNRYHFESKTLTILGNNTLGIYAISNFLFIVLKKISRTFNTINYLYTIIECVLVLLLSMIIIHLIKRIKIVSKVLLGE